MKFCTVVDVPGLITLGNFSDHGFRGFGGSGGVGVEFPLFTLTYAVVL